MGGTAYALHRLLVFTLHILALDDHCLTGAREFGEQCGAQFLNQFCDTLYLRRLVAHALQQLLALESQGVMARQGLATATHGTHAATITATHTHTATDDRDDLVDVGGVLRKLHHIVVKLELDANLDELLVVL